jgi:hypothetical protein
MLGCKPAVSPIDVKAKISADVGEQVDRERYQRLVGKLIYLCHTHSDMLICSKRSEPLHA